MDPYSQPGPGATPTTSDGTQDRGMMKNLLVAGAVVGTGVLAYKIIKKRKRIKKYRSMPDGSQRAYYVEVDCDPSDPDAYEVNEHGVPIDPNVRARLENEDRQTQAQTQVQAQNMQPPAPQGYHPAQQQLQQPSPYQQAPTQTYQPHYQQPQQPQQPMQYGYGAPQYPQHQPPPQQAAASYPSMGAYGQAPPQAMPYQAPAPAPAHAPGFQYQPQGVQYAQPPQQPPQQPLGQAQSFPNLGNASVNHSAMMPPSFG